MLLALAACTNPDGGESTSDTIANNDPATTDELYLGYEKDDILSNRTECDGIQWEMIIGTKQAELRFTIKKKRQSQKDREKTSEK